MRTDVIDLYLLHWPGSVPLAETIAGFMDLRDLGKFKDFGVSNFDIEHLRKLESLDADLTGTKQVLYNLEQREAEAHVNPECLRRGIPVMAYCPLAQGNVVQSLTLQEIAYGLA